jgi:hypothetical protein
MESVVIIPRRIEWEARNYNVLRYTHVRAAYTEIYKL